MTTTSVSVPGCYRHPEREAAGRCLGCGRPICSDCTTMEQPASPGCDPVRKGTEVRRGTYVATPRPYAAMGLMALSLAAAIVCVVADSRWLSGELGDFGRRGALVGGAVLVGPGSFDTVGVAHGEWYRVVTAAFLHIGPIHLAFNMVALWQGGVLLEPRLGRLRFCMVYGVAVLGGAFGSLLIHPEHFAAGASGGVFGLFGALFLAERRGFFGTAGNSFGILIGINLFLTFAIPGISVGGHVGGLVAGAALAWVMFEFDARALPRTLPTALAACLSVALFAGCLWAATLSSDPFFGV